MWIVTIKEVDEVDAGTSKVEETYREAEKARQASAEAWKAWIKAKVDCENARVAWNEANTAYGQAWTVYREAREARDGK